MTMPAPIASALLAQKYCSTGGRNIMWNAGQTMVVHEYRQDKVEHRVDKLET